MHAKQTYTKFNLDCNTYTKLIKHGMMLCCGVTYLAHS